jgi:hypothetical protein
MVELSAHRNGDWMNSTTFQTTWGGLPPLSPLDVPQQLSDSLRDWRTIGDESPGSERIGVGRPILGYFFLKFLDRRYIFGDDKPATGRAPRRLLQDVQFGAIREPVVDESRPKHPFLASRFRQVVLDEASAHRLASLRRTSHSVADSREHAEARYLIRVAGLLSGLFGGSNCFQ